jgi:hypothetical protein
VPISEKVIFFSARSVVDAKTLGHQFIPCTRAVLLLLLLLLLLAGIEHAPLGQRDRLAQHVEIADVIGEDQHQRRIEIGALLVAQAAMRLDDGAKASSGLAKFELVDSAMTNLS